MSATNKQEKQTYKHVKVVEQHHVKHHHRTGNTHRESSLWNLGSMYNQVLFHRSFKDSLELSILLACKNK